MQVSSYLKLSVAVAVATIALKTGAWWGTGSVGLLSDAMESLVNLAGAAFALKMVTVAALPPVPPEVLAALPPMRRLESEPEFEAALQALTRASTTAPPFP